MHGSKVVFQFLERWIIAHKFLEAKAPILIAIGLVHNVHTSYKWRSKASKERILIVPPTPTKILNINDFKELTFIL